MKLNEIKEDGWYWCKSAFHGVYITYVLTIDNGTRNTPLVSESIDGEWIKADCPFEEGK